MRLKARDRPASSSPVGASGTRTPRSPPRTRSAALISVPIGRAIWLAMTRPISPAAEQHQQRHDGEDPGEGDLQPGPVLIQPLVFRHRLLGALHVAQDLRIDRPADHQHQRRRRIRAAPPPAPACRRRAFEHHDIAVQRLLRSPSAAAARRPGRRTARPRPAPGRWSARRSPPRSGRAAWSACPAPRRTRWDRPTGTGRRGARSLAISSATARMLLRCSSR